ncbi:putative Long chain acyl-CoA synthetase 7, peroxisomal [Blattamonas nauphoetae]|uniref:Long chain acyl-CoA synthetase 7, peroxisomal n=1 Tax=Blattamonas nauphoetae TaxID=2049346 RepID=A0ABQ9XKQ9_9EUKA|nr:putative Long chain acyl-CoA synthetase 7, peroxisomal [Blattamonas nauphoetae]
MTDPTINGDIHGSLVPLPEWTKKHTRYSALERVIPRFAERNCLGTREFLTGGKRGKYVWETYSTVFHKINAVALGLKEIGLKKGDHVGIMSVNRPEWTILDIACSAIGCVTVPIYDSYGPDNCEYIMTTANTKCVVCAVTNFEFVKEACTRCSFVTDVVLFDGSPLDEEYISSHSLPRNESNQSLASCGFNFYFSQVQAKGEEILKSNPNTPISDPSVRPDDLDTIIYTSGTSGRPKGAMLSHTTLLTGGWSYAIRLTYVPYQDVIISYLPLAHVFQRAVDIFTLTNGVAIGYFSGSIAQLTEDIGILQPTLFPAVPLCHFSSHSLSFTRENPISLRPKKAKCCRRIENTMESLCWEKYELTG